MEAHVQSSSPEMQISHQEIVATSLKGERGPQATDPLWDYTTHDRKNNQCVCKLCGKVNRGRNFTTLKRHLEKNHGENFAEYEAKKKKLKDEKAKKAAESSKTQTKVDSYAVSSKSSEKKLSRNSAMSVKIDRGLYFFLASCSVSHRLVELESFQYLFECLNPQYKLPCRKNVPKKIANLVQEMRQNVLAHIQQAKSVSICLDIWTQKGLKYSYVGITAHYFDQESGCLQCALLAVKNFSHLHSAEKVLQFLKLLT